MFLSPPPFDGHFPVKMVLKVPLPDQWYKIPLWVPKVKSAKPFLWKWFVSEAQKWGCFLSQHLSEASHEHRPDFRESLGILKTAMYPFIFMNYQNELVAILTINVEFDGVLKYRRSLWMPNINTIWRTITITQQNVETPAKNVARPSKSKVRLE